VTLTSLPQGAAADGYGHGSFVAEVAAGRGDGEAGAAPTAPIVSLDVMDDNGMAFTSDVVAAADWIYTHKGESGIRVANFSLIGSSPASVMFDPLDRALERLWLSGVVVVTAAGNYGVDGKPTDVAFAPANDPFVITVGAGDPANTVPTTDDFAAPWSVYGHTFDGFAKPELGAPGRYIVAAVPTDSTLYRTRPDRVVAPGRLQLSGTSFAAPLVAGVAANLLALHPDWTPDQVKGALMLTAAPLPAAAPFSLGVGEVDAAAASAVTNPPNPNAALNSFLVPDPLGTATPVFDAASWGTAARPQRLLGHCLLGHCFVGHDLLVGGFLGHRVLGHRVVGHGFMGYRLVGHGFVGHGPVERRHAELRRLLDALAALRRRLPRPFVERDRARSGDVQRLGACDRDPRVDVSLHLGRQPFALRAEQECDTSGKSTGAERLTAVCFERNPSLC
jgi:hypothetical protein